tara:strand:- start:219 stop:1031 length:813 start_codon:yes stop_codon:yes gene_type:complete
MKEKNILKVILLKFFKRDNAFIKILKIIANSFLTFKIIKKISLKFSIILIPQLIKDSLIFEKNRNKMNLNNNEKKIYFEEKYNFNFKDWFSGNIFIWEIIVNKIEKIDYLEIGSFEGRSTVFMGELNNLNSIAAIDTWEGSDEHNSEDKRPEISFNKVFENFKNNLNIINKPNINYFKTTSDNFFKNNKKNYNLIYIDGSHHYNDVKNDFINSFNCLKNNGYIICDDFLWFFYDQPELNPMKAVLECYEKFKKNLKIEFLYYQIIFKKIE